jgi:hypothetical protein
MKTRPLGFGDWGPVGPLAGGNGGHLGPFVPRIGGPLGPLGSVIEGRFRPLGAILPVSGPPAVTLVGSSLPTGIRTPTEISILVSEKMEIRYCLLEIALSQSGKWFRNIV